MPNKPTHYKNKYRIASTRLKGWDYATQGHYFVTICTKHKIPWFGKVREGEMILSESGMIVAEEWLLTAQIRPHVELDVWVIMPNHIHGIFILHDETNTVETPRRGVSTTNTANSWRPSVLGAIVNQFKSKCTKRIRNAGYPEFAWQGRFHDHILRDDRSLQSAQAYILGNPVKWEADDLYQIN